MDLRDPQSREELLAQAVKVAEEAEVFWVSRQETPAIFEANRLKRIEYRETSGVALRIIKDGRIGFSSTTNMEDGQGLIQRALELAPFGADARLQFPSTRSYEPVDVYDPRVEALPLEEMVNTGQTLIDGVRSRWPEVLCEARVGKSISSVGILNTRGCRSEYTKSIFGMSIEGTLIRGTDMLFVGDSKASCQLEKDTDTMISLVLEQLELARETVPPPDGEVPILFTPRGVAGTLISPLLVGFNGKTVLQGTSPLVGKLGQRLVDQRFSLWDDPTLTLAPGSRICDDEGVPSQRVPLIQSGVVANFLYDLQTAAQAKARSTASAGRSLGSLPAPSASVLLVGEGDASDEEMIADVREGLVVEGLLGSGQGNILGGDFKANVLLGYKIENGRIVGRVKDTMISGNVYKALNSIRAIGREARWVGGFLKTPALCCEGIHVAGSS